MDCFNEISKICYVNTYVHSLKVWPKSVLLLLKYNFLLWGCFYWCTLYMYRPIGHMPDSIDNCLHRQIVHCCNSPLKSKSLAN